MKDYLKACWQHWVEMWHLNLGCSVFTLIMWHFAYEIGWAASFLALASLQMWVTFIPEALCRLQRGLGR